MTVRPVAPRTAVARVSWRSDRRVPRLLWAMLAAAVAIAVGLGIAAGMVFSAGRSVVTVLAEDAGPASIDTARVHAALSDADRLAATQFLSHGAERLGGAGPQHQENIKIALQGLARVAAAAPGGHAGAEDVQAIEALIVLYMGYISQAHAKLDHGTLGVTYLAYASHLMHDPAEGIIARVDKLAGLGAADVDRRLSTPWLSSTMLTLHAVGGAVLVGLLVGIQVFLVRHFRRWVNLGLFVATALGIVLVVLTSLQLADTRNDLHDGGAALESATGLWAARAVLGDSYGARARSLVITPDDARALSDADAGGAAGQLWKTDAAAMAGAKSFDSLDRILDRGATAGEHAEVSRAKRQYGRFKKIDGNVAELAGADRPKAVALTLGSGADGLPGAFRQVDGALDAAAESTQRRFDAAMSDAASGRQLGLGIPLLSGGVAILVIIGMFPGIREYR